MQITLDKERELCYNFAALKKFEEVSGKSIFKCENSVTDLSVMLWAGLLKEDPKLTLKQVEEMCTASQIPYINETVTKAMEIPDKAGGDPLPK